MAGLLDFLSSPDYGNGVGGLLSYLNSPLYRVPNNSQSEQAAYQATLAQDPGIGFMPQTSIWDQPGITYKGAPAPTAFDTGVAPVAGLPGAATTAGPAALGGWAPGQQTSPTTPVVAAPQVAPPQPSVLPAQNVAAADAPPIAVGNYQMPRVGSSDLYASQAALPPNAQPTQGQLPQQFMQQPQQLPPALGGGLSNNPLLRGIQSLGRGGGLISALTGNYNDPQSITQENLRAQFLALSQQFQRNGLSPQDAASRAMLTILNPEAAKTTLPQLQKLKDITGAEVPYWANQNTQTLQPALGGAGASGGGGIGQIFQNIATQRAAGASPEQLLQQVPPEYRGYVQSVLAGQALPTNMGRSQIRAPVMMMVHAINPNFDESSIPLHTQTVEDYGPKGKSGQAFTSFNTVQHHIGKLSDDIENLKNTGYTHLNAGLNAIRSDTPYDPQQQKVIQAVNDDIKAVTDEMSNAYKTGHVSDTEIEAWNKLVSSNLPLPRLRQGIADFVQLLNGKRDALNFGYRAIVKNGQDAPLYDRQENEAITQKVMSRNIEDGTTATNPQTGQKLIRKGGQWVPLQ